MENASKALLMAAGILLAMLIISMYMLLSDNISNIGKSEEDKKASEQLAKFNKEYEAYNKKVLYGTEVISVMNKAIDNNRRAEVDPEQPWFVDVHIYVERTFQTITIETKNGIEGEPKKTGGVLDAKKTYKLGKEVGEDKKVNNAGIVEFFEGNATDEVIQVNAVTVIHKSSALTDFKRAIFTCESIEYDQNTRKSICNKI